MGQQSQPDRLSPRPVGTAALPSRIAPDIGKVDNMPSFSRNGVGVFAFLVILLLGQGAAAQRFGRNKIQYENFDWRVLSTPHFEIFFYPEEEALAARAAVIAEDAYLRLSEVFDHKFSSQVPFILYASPNDFQQTNVSPGLIGEGTGGFSEPLRNRMVLPYP
ncbi:MAG TPA: hypothetical protein VGB13_10090, partial [Candidatus Krumholzibacteria bacterium]